VGKTTGEWMLDLKILNWMMQGSVNITEVYREIEYDLLKRVVFHTYKPALNIIHDYYSRHKTPPSYDVLEALLDKDGEDKKLSSQISGKKCPPTEIGFCLDEIKERYNKFLIENIVEKASKLEEDGETIKDFNDELKKMVSQTEKLYKHDVFSEGNICDSVQDRIHQYKYTSEHPDEIMGFLSGYKVLDDYTWGVKNSEMLVIGGASSSGKSLLMLNMAVNAWLGSNRPGDGIVGHTDGKNILFVSLEMSKKQLEQRVDANIATVKHRNLARGSMEKSEEERWMECLKFQETYDKKFYILDMPRGTTMGEIDAKFENILGIFKPDAIFVDYLQLMKPTIESTGTDWLDVGRVSEELHEFCRKKNIPVVTAAQRKAAQKKTGGKKVDNVDLEDLGRSKMVGDNAAIVLLIANRDDELLREDMEIHIVKNRDGAKGKINLRKVFDKSKIEEFPDDWAGDTGDENEV
jgi:replicative DNA helicase